MTQEKAEFKIKEAAHSVFMEKGMAGARMQEIADKAGINKALLHYYYRSKELLFKAVFEGIIKRFIPKMISLVTSDLPLEAKVYQMADKYIDFLSEHREMPLFVLTELRRGPEKLVRALNIDRLIDLSMLQNQLNEEAAKGNIRHIEASQFMLNFVSMMVFPFAAGHMFTSIFGVEEEDFKKIMEARKTEVPKFIMNALRP